MRTTALTLSLLASGICSFATDIHVGPNLEVSDLATASAMASDGDRILVEAGDYRNFAISKSISLLPSQEGVGYTVSGDIDLGGANGKNIFISGLKAPNGVLSQGVRITASVIFSQPSKLTIVDSELRAVIFSAQPQLRVELFRSMIHESVRVESFGIYGCRIWGNGSWSEVVLAYNGSALDQDNFVVGCVLGYPITSVGLPQLVGLMIVNINRPIHFENNIVHALHCAISITGGTNMDVPSTVVNNTHFGSVVVGATVVPSLIGHFGLGNPPATNTNIIVRNNARVAWSSSSVEPIGLDGTPPNMIESNNLAVPLALVDLNTGVPVPGSTLINGGHPHPRYLDLDLTTNDVGCYGGSNSLANFTTPMGSAVVGFMRAPRIVAQGSPVNISAIGFDR